MIEITIAVKNYSLNTSRFSFLSDHSTDLLSLLNLWHLLQSKRRSRSQGTTIYIIDHLSINLLVGTEYTETWALSSSVDVLTDTELYLNSSLFFLCCHNSKSLKIT